MIRKKIYARIEVSEYGAEWTCNKCGQSVPKADAHSFRAGSEFETLYPGGEAPIQFELCSTCLKALVESFTVPPLWETDLSLRLQASPSFDVSEPVIREDKDEVWDWRAAGYVFTGRAIPELSEACSDLIYEHFKGGLYYVYGWLLPEDKQERYSKALWAAMGTYDPEPRVEDFFSLDEAFVVYRALYGAQPLIARSYASWASEPKPGIPRFKPVRVMPPVPMSNYLGE